MKLYFSIEKINEKTIQKIDIDSPINREFETFIITENGSFDVMIDFNSIDTNTPNMLYIPKAISYQFQPKSETYSYWKIEFNSLFSTDFFYEINKFYNNRNYLDFSNSPCFGNLLSLCEMIAFEQQQTQQKFDIISNLWNSIFSIFKSELTRQNNDLTEEKLNHRFYQFLLLLEEHYKQENSIEFYATKLAISPRQLSKITQDVVDKNITTLINSRKIIEAKKEILNSAKTISEIGYELGFNEKAYFTKVFKTYVGLSPSDFRKNMTLN